MNERCSPMLAVRGEPFDSAEYLFEVKWNGIRALAKRHTQGWDLWGRELADYRSRYPEMQVLAALPPGTILDGELVLLSQGVPNLEAILARHQLSHPAKILHGRQHQPVTYVVSDLLAHRGRSLVGQPLQARRALLQDLLARQEARLQFSEGIVGPGRLFFEQAVRAGQEGVMASTWPAVTSQVNARRAGSRSNRRGVYRVSSLAGSLASVACAACWWRRRGGAGCVTWPTCARALATNTGTACRPRWRAGAAPGRWSHVRTGGSGWSRSLSARSITWSGRVRAACAAPASTAC